MQFYLAPLEGITGYIVRNAFAHHFPYIDKYFTPFFPAAKKMNKKIMRDLIPENNPGITLVPQLMLNDAEDLRMMGAQLEQMGFTTVNLNCGCPSGTVVSKRRGAGILGDPDELDRFLENAFDICPLSISVKTRIGMESEDEWEKLCKIYARYPFEELIVHPRVRSDFYSNSPRLDAFSYAVEMIRVPLCYNGDINTVEDYERIHTLFPTVDRVMIGRGLLADPNLVTRLAAGRKSEKKTYREFHDTLYAAYGEQFQDDRIRINCMKELWTFMGQSFADTGRFVKGIHKAGNRVEYEAAVRMLFANCELQPLRNGLQHP